MKNRIIIALAVLLLSGGAAWGATFGNTDFASATTVVDLDGLNDLENFMVGGKFTLSEAATVQSITAKMRVTTAAKDMKGMIYRASDSILFGMTETINVATGAPVEQTFNFQYIVNLPADDYWIVAWSAAGSGVAALYFASSGGTSNYDAETFATTPPYNFVRTVADQSRIYAIYATYTAGTTPILGRNLGAGGGASSIEDLIRVGSGPSNVASESGTVDSMSVLLEITGAATSIPVTMVVYDYDSNLVGVSTERSITTAAGVRQWYHFQPSGTINITSGTGYLIGAWSDDAGVPVFRVVTPSAAYGATTADSIHGDAATYPTEPDPLVPTVLTQNSRVQAYLVYSPLAVEIPKRRRLLQLQEQGWFVREALKDFAGGTSEISR